MWGRSSNIIGHTRTFQSNKVASEHNGLNIVREDNNVKNLQRDDGPQVITLALMDMSHGHRTSLAVKLPLYTRVP